MDLFPHTLDAQGFPIYNTVCGPGANGFGAANLITICDSVFTRYTASLQEVKKRNAAVPDGTPISNEKIPGQTLVHEIMHASSFNSREQSKKFVLYCPYTRILLI